MSRFIKIFITLAIFILFSFILKENAFAACGCASDGSYYCYTCDTRQYGHYTSVPDCPSPCAWCPSDTGWQYTCCYYTEWVVGGCESACDSGCTPPACAPTYDTVNHGVGSITTSCTDDCGDTETRTCYLYRCDDCTLPNCPAPLLNSALPTDPVNLVLANFRSCTRSGTCGGASKLGDCYEPYSVQPTVALRNPSETLDLANIYGFRSIHHIGIPKLNPTYNLNEPLNLEARYTDLNGSSDIEAIYVWFRDTAYAYPAELSTPLFIASSGNPKAPAQNSWGFMMHRENGSWYPYVPDYTDPSNAKWVKVAGYNTSLRTFYIPGTTSTKMVAVTITGTNGITESGNTVTMPFRLRFSNYGTYTDILQETSPVTYRVLLMAHDKFSFTPYDNYDNVQAIKDKIGNYWQANQLRYRNLPAISQKFARNWNSYINAGQEKFFTIDKVAPFSTVPFSVAYNNGKIEIKWNVEDAKGLYSIVGNIYSSSTTYPMTLSGTTGIIFPSGTSFSPSLYTNQVIGHLTVGRAFAVAPDMAVKTHTGTVYVDPGANRDGSLNIYLTVFDDAGNITQYNMLYLLEDWIVSDGGLAYSQGGTGFKTKIPSSPTDTWGSVLPLRDISPLVESLTFAKGDLSSEMWAEGAGGLLTPLTKSSITNKSYKIVNFGGYNFSSYYDRFYQLYLDNKTNLGTLLVEKTLGSTTTELTSTLTANYCGNQSTAPYCVLLKSGPLFVNTGFICDQKAVIFVNGDLTIGGKIKNHAALRRDSDACMFIVTGNIVIQEGDNASPSTLGYDEINAYLFSDKQIIINAETTSKTRYDGLYINGGIQALGGIKVNRYLKLVDRMKYPALAVDHHSRYGILGRIFFGSDYTFQKTEVGFR